MPITIDGTGLAGSPGLLRVAVELYAVNDRAVLSLIESKTGDLYETFTSNVPSETLADNEVVSACGACQCPQWWHRSIRIASNRFARLPWATPVVLSGASLQ